LGDDLDLVPEPVAQRAQNQSLIRFNRVDNEGQIVGASQFWANSLGARHDTG